MATFQVYYKEKSLSLGFGGWNKFSERLLNSRLYDFMVSKHYYYLKREKIYAELLFWKNKNEKDLTSTVVFWGIAI